MRPRRILFAVNPSARSGGAPLDRVVDRLRFAGVTIGHDYRGEADGLSSFIKTHAGDVDAVVVGGGDGTVSSAVGAVMAAGLPLGVLPLGTANDFARTLGLPQDPLGAAAVIAAGVTRRIDVGEVNGAPFLNVASIGLSAQLAQSLTRETKRRFGPLSYLITSLKVVLRARSVSGVLRGANGATRFRTLQLAVGNGRFYGAGMTVAPDARIDDGQLDLYSLETTRLWRLAILAPAIRSGQHHAAPEVRSEKGAWFEVVTSRPRHINVDGELRGMTPARFMVRPQALEVFVPEEGSPD
jgi:YegS/Rv2252/BmrU family lipid kinase